MKKTTEKDVAEFITANAEVPASSTQTNLSAEQPAEEKNKKPAEQPAENKNESEEAFVEEVLGEIPEAEVEEEKTEKPEEENSNQTEKTDKNKEAEEKPQAEPEEEILKVEPPKVSRLDKRLTQKYIENLVLKGAEIPSDEEVAEELSQMSLEEKKNALRNLLDENRSLRGQEPEPLSLDDQEVIIEAEVERRYQEEQRKLAEIKFQEDLIATLAEHPELDSRRKEYNPKLEKAVAKVIDSGVLPSEAYKIVMEAVETAKQKALKQAELEAQKSMSGAVSSLPVTEEIISKRETEEDRFIADALGL